MSAGPKQVRLSLKRNASVEIGVPNRISTGMRSHAWKHCFTLGKSETYHVGCLICKPLAIRNRTQNQARRSRPLVRNRTELRDDLLVAFVQASARPELSIGSSAQKFNTVPDQQLRKQSGGCDHHGETLH